MGGAFTSEQVIARLELEISQLERYGAQYWPMFSLDTSNHLGCCGLKPREPEAGVWELGFHLRPVYWGKGYAEEAARAVLGHAFGTLGVRSVFAGHHPDNAPSGRILTRLGFRYTHDEFYPPTGAIEPCYCIDRPGWAGQ